MPIATASEPAGQAMTSAGHATGVVESHFGTPTHVPLQVWTPQVVPAASHVHVGSVVGHEQALDVEPAAVVHAQPSQEMTHFWLELQSESVLHPVDGVSSTQTPVQSVVPVLALDPPGQAESWQCFPEAQSESFVHAPVTGLQVQGPPQEPVPAQLSSSPALQLGKVHPQIGVLTVAVPLLPEVALAADPALATQGHW